MEEQWKPMILISDDRSGGQPSVQGDATNYTTHKGSGVMSSSGCFASWPGTTFSNFFKFNNKSEVVDASGLISNHPQIKQVPVGTERVLLGCLELYNCTHVSVGPEAPVIDRSPCSDNVGTKRAICKSSWERMSTMVGLKVRQRCRHL